VSSDGLGRRFFYRKVPVSTDCGPSLKMTICWVERKAVRFANAHLRRDKTAPKMGTRLFALKMMLVAADSYFEAGADREGEGRVADGADVLLAEEIV
jgi:hypothetical protein